MNSALMCLIHGAHDCKHLLLEEMWSVMLVVEIGIGLIENIHTYIHTYIHE